MTESKTDLFGEVVVTWEDVRLWLTVVPRIDPDSPRAGRYVLNWNVPAKIRAAKLAGWFDQLQPARPSLGYSQTHHRLRWPETRHYAPSERYHSSTVSTSSRPAARSCAAFEQK